MTRASIHMHLILRWFEIRIIFASNPISLRILSNLRIFGQKNMEVQIALELSCSSKHGAVLPGIGWRFSYRELASPGIPSFERVT